MSHSSFEGGPPLKTDPNVSLISVIVVNSGVSGTMQLRMAEDRYLSLDMIPFEWVFALSLPHATFALLISLSSHCNEASTIIPSAPTIWSCAASHSDSSDASFGATI